MSIPREHVAPSVITVVNDDLLLSPFGKTCGDYHRMAHPVLFIWLFIEPLTHSQLLFALTDIEFKRKIQRQI